MREVIKFVNGLGMVFFECSQAEARMAMRKVEDARQNKDQWKAEGQRLRQEFDALFAGAKDMPSSLTMLVDGEGLSASSLSSMFAQMEKDSLPVTHIFLNAIRYADLRKWDRDCLDIETEMYKLSAGWMASLWGAKIIVREGVSDSDAIMASSQKTRMDSKGDKFIRWEWRFSGKPEVCKDSGIRQVLDRLQAIETMMKDMKKG